MNSIWFLMIVIVFTSSKHTFSGIHSVEGVIAHHVEKRGWDCNFRGESCTKDLECCTTSCLCIGSEPCFCGKRARPKIVKGESRSREKLPQPQKLICKA